MLRSLGTALLVFVILLGIGLGAIWASALDASVLSKPYLDRAQQAAAAATAAAPSPDAGQVIDAAPNDTAAADVTQLETFREDAHRKLNIWLLSAMGFGLLACWGWLLFAHGHAGKVVGPESARAAAGAWWGGLVACALGIGVASFLALQIDGVAELVSSSAAALGLGLAVALPLLGYFGGTLVGAPRIVRPSVPLATLLLR